MKIKYSALVSDARGKLNGSVASKNRYGNYLRNKVTPVNPQSSSQQFFRGLFGAMAGLWRGLTQTQRDGWITAAANFPFTDIFGDIKYLSGQALFTKLGVNLQKLGIAVKSAPPSPVAIPNIGSVTGAVESDNGVLDSIDVTVSAPVPSGFTAVVYATPPVPAGQLFVKNKYRYIDIIGSGASTVDIMSNYQRHFGGSAPIGQRVFFRVALVSTENGQQGTAHASDTEIVSV